VSMPLGDAESFKFEARSFESLHAISELIQTH